ncbi:MAG: hypothetical protein K8F90_10720 [Hyphomicrobiales bacterium]|jgi:hypothetical protein|nr:hypothetical protein [Hyphomicrobiales bacterium]
MAKSKTNLNAALEVAAVEVVASAPAPRPTLKYPVPPSREGTTLVGAHLAGKYGRTLKLLSATTGQTQRQLLEEALDMLFTKKGTN